MSMFEYEGNTLVLNELQTVLLAILISVDTDLPH